MAGINFLYEEYKKNPKRIEELLLGEIEISEKLDGSRFLVQAYKGELKFFKRKDAHITSIDRTLSKYYEKAIIHFENLPNEKIAKFPDGWRFGMEYFPNLQPVTISYEKLPLNHLVLTDIQVRDPRDKTVDVITDKKTLSEWADILEIERPPIIFEGKLSDVQVRKILDFLNTPYSSLIKRFKTENFTGFILTMLSPSLKSSFLNNNLEKEIDGLVFRFDGKEAYRVSNPEVVLSKSEKKEQKPSDIYNLTLVILQEFLTSIDFKKIKLKEKSFEERYIEFISKVFNLFTHSSEYKKNFTGEVDFELPRFLTREESGVNFKFVKDPETLELLKVSNTNRELFKILLASMRSHKRKASGFFSKELISHHNELVDKIADYINSNLKESFFTFEEFRNVFLGESNMWQEYGKDTGDDVENISEAESVKQPLDLSVFKSPNVSLDESHFPSFQHVTKSQEYDNIKPSIDVLKRMFTEPEKKDELKKTNGVCLMKGKFLPIHNGHLSIIEDACKESGAKVFLIIMNRRSEPLGISRELHRSMLDAITKDNKNIHGYEFSDGRSMEEICSSLPKSVSPVCFSGSPDECEDVVCQMGDDFRTIPATRHISSKTVLEKIKNEDYDGYKKLVPASLHNYFYKIKNEMHNE